MKIISKICVSITATLLTAVPLSGCGQGTHRYQYTPSLLDDYSTKYMPRTSLLTQLTTAAIGAYAGREIGKRKGFTKEDRKENAREGTWIGAYTGMLAGDKAVKLLDAERQKFKTEMAFLDQEYVQLSSAITQKDTQIKQSQSYLSSLEADYLMLSKRKEKNEDMKQRLMVKKDAVQKEISKLDYNKESIEKSQKAIALIVDTSSKAAKPHESKAALKKKRDNLKKQSQKLTSIYKKNTTTSKDFAALLTEIKSLSKFE